jgi:ATP phosphoribosyltransferase regulatory subunit
MSVQELYVDLGHVGVFSLMTRFQVPPELGSRSCRAKTCQCRELVANLDDGLREALLLLPELYGGSQVLDTARKSLPDFPEIALALDQMDTIARDLQSVAEVHCFDLAGAQLLSQRNRVRRLCARTSQCYCAGRALR